LGWVIGDRRAAVAGRSAVNQSLPDSSCVGLDDRAAARVVERGGGGLVKSGTVRGGSSSALEAIAIACAGPHDDESERPAGDPSRL
jgi:hypothetical protein